MLFLKAFLTHVNDVNKHGYHRSIQNGRKVYPFILKQNPSSRLREYCLHIFRVPYPVFTSQKTRVDRFACNVVAALHPFGSWRAQLPIVELFDHSCKLEQFYDASTRCSLRGGPPQHAYKYFERSSTKPRPDAG